MKLGNYLEMEEGVEKKERGRAIDEEKNKEIEKEMRN